MMRLIVMKSTFRKAKNISKKVIAVNRELRHMFTRKRIITWIFMLAFMGFLATGYYSFATRNEGIKFQSQQPKPVVEIPTNTVFKITKTSKSYDVNPAPSCYIANCTVANNLDALGPCQSQEASDWLKIGVQSMERYLNGDVRLPTDYGKRALIDALRYFKKSIQIDPKCPSAHQNLGLVFMALDDYVNADIHFKKVYLMTLIAKLF